MSAASYCTGCAELRSELARAKALLERAAPMVKATLADIEEADSEFYRDTGMLAPGKSYPLAMNGSHPSNDERRAAWNAWIGPRIDKLNDDIRAALAGDAK